MTDIDLGKFWDTLKSSGAQTSLLVALIGQATAGLVFQVNNNAEQAAGIQSTQAQIRDFKEQVTSLQTPLGQRFIKLEERVDDAIRRAETLQSPIGIRYLHLETVVNEAIKTSVGRMEQLNNLSDRMLILEKRVLEFENKNK